MIITKNPAATLELCYVVDKLQPSNLDAVKETDYIVKGGQRNRIHWDRDGRIVFVPPERHDVKESKPSRAGTTNRVATKTMIGRVIAAAENQDKAPRGQRELRAALLRFLYDPECPPEKTKIVREFWQHRMRSLIPHTQTKKRARAAELVDPLLLHFSQLLRTGIERYSESDLCKYMGFVNTRDASYAKEYRRIVGSLLLQMQDLENLAMRPVVDVINDMFAEPAKPMPIIRFYSGPAADAEEDRAPALLPRHSTVLSLRKKDLASI
jgi:hypothetical protein